MSAMQRFTRIPSIDSVQRLPRIGKLGLGIKALSEKTGKAYPREVAYFVLDAPGPDATQQQKKTHEAFVKVYGKEPKYLDIIIPPVARDKWFAQSLKCYGANGRLRCHGDGEHPAWREKGLFPPDQQSDKVDGDYYPFEPCPCDLYGRDCKRMGNLMFILPRVNLTGVWQIDTSSFYSITNINNEAEYLEGLLGPLWRKPIVTHTDEKGATKTETLLILSREPQPIIHAGKSTTHYTMHLRVRHGSDLNFDTLALLQQQMRTLGPSDAPPKRIALPEPSLETELIPGGQTVPTTTEDTKAPTKPLPKGFGKAAGLGDFEEAESAKPAEVEPEPAEEAQEEMGFDGPPADSFF